MFDDWIIFIAELLDLFVRTYFAVDAIIPKISLLRRIVEIYTMQTSIVLTALMWHMVHSFTCTSQGIFLNTDDASCQTYVFCAQLTSGTFISNVYSCPTGNLFNPDTSNCDPNYVCSAVRAETTQLNTTPIQVDVACTAQGRFPNNTDSTCSSYYYCYYLTSGAYNVVSYSCPQDSRFDPTTQTCSTTYECGSNTLSSTVDGASTTSTSFECTTQGRFPAEDDTTCSNYYFCFYLTSGSYIRRNYSCPSGNRFDPTSQTCTTTYQCSRNTADSTTNAAQTIAGFQCTSQGRFSVETDATCSSYYFCFYLSTGRYIQYTYTCPSNTRFDPTLQTCSAAYSCTTSSETLTSSNAPEANNLRALTSRCEKQGRFLVTTDPTCRSYYYCYFTNGTFIEYSYFCPSGSRFDEISGTCNTSHKCQQSTESVSSITSNDISFQSSTTTKPLECLSQGRFSVDGDDTCRSYYYCIYLTNGSYISQQYRCPSQSKFNPRTQFCDASYECVSSTTALRNLGFQCGSSGKFPDVQSLFCRNYYYCLTLPNGIIAQQLYSCSSGENFDPNLQECSQNYQCPQVKSEIAIQSRYECKTTGKFQAEDDPMCQNYYYCISLPNGEFKYQQYSCSAGEKFDPKQQSCSMSYECHFRCPTAGKFPATEDLTCQTYHYCFTLSNDLFGKQLYACAEGQKFDPKLQICSKSYQCSL
ncbi:hypothetical protein WA026_009750 [Henosepilachna vigintioctopunctata]|uniref:Chitin-binding type-2 domain-containing protein n=1 Tax=Henosepilachna vigintioctopunctata TaxID=420089 RepID=A0AAW1TKX1_9CUCU